MDIVKVVKEKGNEFCQFAKENWMDLVGTVVMVGTGAAAVGVMIKAVNDSQKSIWDKKNEWYVACDRKISNTELANILKECRERKISLTEILCERDIRTYVWKADK